MSIHGGLEKHHVYPCEPLYRLKVVSEDHRQECLLTFVPSTKVRTGVTPTGTGVDLPSPSTSRDSPRHLPPTRPVVPRSRRRTARQRVLVCTFSVSWRVGWTPSLVLESFLSRVRGPLRAVHPRPRPTSPQFEVHAK